MGIKIKQVVLNKLKNSRKDSLSKKVDLGLMDEIEYDFDSLQDEVGRLSYSTEEWFEENFDKFLEARSLLREVYINFTEGFLDPVDVEKDLERLNNIIEQSENLGIDPTQVDPNIFDHIQLIKDLEYFNNRFIEQRDQLKQYGF